MGQRVTRVKSSVSEKEMAQAIYQGWKELFGTIPSKEQVDLILAQNSLETGHRKSMFNFNIGNITTSGGGPYDFYDDLTTDEQVQPGVWKKKNLKYRAYPSLLEGVKDYLKFISGSHYSQAWQHILNPNPIEFSKSLKQAGYYTANEKPYTDALSQLYNHYKSNNYSTNKPGIIPNSNIINIEDLLGKYLKQVAAMDYNKTLYKKYLPHQCATICIEADDHTNAIEFARILTLALDEDLYAMASIHGENNVEVECIIPGPAKECFAAVKQLTEVLAEVFKDSTHKIGGVAIKTKIFTNKTSSYQPISVSKLEIEHRKFLFKIAQG